MNKKFKRFLTSLIVVVVLGSNVSVLAHTSQEETQNKKQYLNDQRNKLEDIRDKKDELMKIIRNLDSRIEAEKFEINSTLSEKNEINKNIKIIKNEILDLKRERENNKELYEKTRNKIYSYKISESTENSFLDKLNKQYTEVQSKTEEYLTNKRIRQGVLEKEDLEKENRLLNKEALVSGLEEERQQQDILLKEIMKEINNQSNLITEELISYAKTFLGTPYLWGGTRPETGFDCSGYTQYVYARLGIKLGRTTYNQLKDGIYIKKENLKPGDLVFFGSWSNPYHNGIYIGDNKFIHSPKTGDVIKISKMSAMKFLTGVRVMK